MGTVEIPRAPVTDSFRQKRCKSSAFLCGLQRGGASVNCELLLTYILGVEPLFPMVRQSQSKDLGFNYVSPSSRYTKSEINDLPPNSLASSTRRCKKSPRVGIVNSKIISQLDSLAPQLNLCAVVLQIDCSAATGRAVD